MEQLIKTEQDLEFEKKLDINSLDFYQELEHYKSNLIESINHCRKLEAEILDEKENHKNEVKRLQDEVSKQKDKYDRLHESHKRVSRINHELEERILNIVDKFNADREVLEEERKKLTLELENNKNYVTTIEKELKGYKSDCHLAVQLLQNNPNVYLAKQIELMPEKCQSRIDHLQQNNSELSRTSKETRSQSFFPITTFPPTAMNPTEFHKTHSSSDLHSKVNPIKLAPVLMTDTEYSESNNLNCRGGEAGKRVGLNFPKKDNTLSQVLSQSLFEVSRKPKNDQKCVFEV